MDIRNGGFQNQHVVYNLYGRLFSGMLMEKQELGTYLKVLIASTDRRVSKPVNSLMLRLEELVEVPETLLSGTQSVDDFFPPTKEGLPDNRPILILLRDQIKDLRRYYPRISEDQAKKTMYA